MSDFELLEVGTFQLMLLWSELTEAYHGVNGFGGNTAEIYAYRFQAFSPMAHWHKSEKDVEAIERKAARQLYALLMLFLEYHESARIFVDDRLIGKWVAEMRFNHRVHIRIE